MYNPRLTRRLSPQQALFAVIVAASLLGVTGAYLLWSPWTSAKVPTPPDVHVDLSSLTAANSAQIAASSNLADLDLPSLAFDRLNMEAGGTLTAAWDDVTHIPRFLSGNNGAVRIPYTPTAAERGNPLAVARGFLDENRALFRLSAVSRDFGTALLEPDTQLNFSHIRLPQLYSGIPVYGRQLVVHLDPGQGIVAVSGQFAPGLTVPTEPTLSGADAEQLALDDLKTNRLDPPESATVKATLLSDKTALTIYIDQNGHPTLTWKVSVLAESPGGTWTIFVNARRPVVVHAIDAYENAKFRRTYTARNSTDLPGRLLIQEGERSSDPVAQAAQDAAGRVYDYYSRTFKRDGIDGRGSPMVSTVHYGSTRADAENAAWIGDLSQIVYGDGGSIFKPLAYGLDVVGHEFTHGITENTSQLDYEGQAGALNESYSDVFGALIDRANWTIGETVVKSPPFPLPFLRSLQDPEVQGNYDPNDPLSGIGQPGSMSDYARLPLSRSADNGGVHINSGVPNHAAYFLAQAIGKEKMEQIYYRTLTQYLSPSSDFLDAGRSTVQAATDLYGSTEANAARAAFGKVGINLGGPVTGPAPPAAGTPRAGTPPPGAVTPLPGIPTSGPTVAPPGRNLPSGCREIVRNGGFESTNDWIEVSARHTQLIDPQLPHTGSQSAWLGGTDKESLQYIYQDLNIPANSTSARLTYYRLLHSEFTGLSGIFAKDSSFTVTLADKDGNQIATLEQLSSSQADDKWKPTEFDLTQYAGKTVRLVYSAENPRGNVSSFFIDDVSLSACTTGQPPSAPPTSSGDQVYVTGTISDADTRRGVSGAQIFFLRPGLSASAAAEDGAVSHNEVETYAVADGQGNYQARAALKRGQTYSVIIVAGGYRPVVADNGLRLSSTASNPTRANATMRSAR